MQIMLNDEISEKLKELVDGIEFMNVTQIVHVATKRLLDERA